MNLIRLFAKALLVSLAVCIILPAPLEAVPLSGNYSVGGVGANFATLSAALNAAQTEGLSGTTNLILNAGTYSGPFEINLPANNHTLMVRAAENATVILNNPDASSAQNYIFYINSTPKVYLQDLRFEASGSYARGLWVHGDSDDLSVVSCTFVNTDSANSSEAIYVTADGSNDADDVLIALNSFQYGYAHIYTNTYHGATNFSGWELYLNHHNSAYYGVYIKQASDLEINALITQNVNSAVVLDQCSGNLDMQRNNISAYQTGVYVYNSSFSLSSPGVVNNVFRISGRGWYNPNYDVDSQGIYIAASENLKVYHNSVRNTSRASGSYSLGVSGTGNLIRKNILASTGSGYAIYAWSLSGNTIEYNNFWSSHSSFARIQNDWITDLEAFNTLTGTGNLAYYPFFTDDQLRTVAPKLDNYGPSYGITTDFNNAPRDATSPDIGAHEFTSDPAMTPLSGTINVGVGQSYTTLQQFFTALSFRGVSGLTTAQLTDTLYVEQVQVFGIPGSNPSYLVQVKGHATLGSTLRWDNQTAADNFVMRLKRMTHIDFHDIRFQTASLQYANLVWMPGYNYKVRFLDCMFKAPVGAQGNGIMSEYQDNNLDLSVLSCGFYNNRLGLQHSGDLLSVGSSWFMGQYQGISLTSSNRCEITGNYFENHSNAAVITNGGNRLLVSHNRIKGTGTGLALYNLSLFENQRNLIYNNRIHVTGGNQSSGVTLGANGINLLNNSILCQSTNSAGLYIYQNGSQTDVVNNIFQAASGLAMEIIYYTPSADFVIDHNDYFSLGTYIVRHGSSYYASLAALGSGDPANNLHSLNVDPHFTEDLHSTSPWLRQAGTMRAEFDDDIDFELRGTQWDIGADQQTGPLGFSPLAGTYTVGQGGNYPSIEAFLDALHLYGTSGNVTANLLAGIYPGYNVIGNFPRVIPGSPLTINALPGASFNLIPSNTYNYENFIFRLDGADTIVFQNIGFGVESSSRQSILILLQGKCDEISLLDCGFNMGSQSSTAIQATSSIASGLLISGCNFTGGSYGVYLSGVSSSAGYNDIRVQHCTMQGTYNPLTISYASGLKLTSNTFADFSATPSLSYIWGNSDILRNKFRAHNFVGFFSSAQMLSLNSLTGTEEQPIEIIANLIYSRGNQVLSVTGISIGNSSWLRLIHNSISVENFYSFEYGSALQMSSCANVWSANNIFSNPGTGLSLNLSQCSALSFNNNAYYNSFKYLGQINSVDYSTTELIQTQLGDTNGIFADPLPDNFGYSGCKYLGGKGLPTYVNSDIDLNVISGTPDIGASSIQDAPALNGTVTVGSTGDYTSLDAALQDLMSRGIAAPTTLWLQSGVHLINKRLGYVPNTLSHSLTISGADNAWIYGSGESAATNYALALKATRNLVLDGLRITNQSMNYSRGVTLDRYNENLSIQNCHFALDPNNLDTDQSSAIYAYNVIAQDFNIQSCQIDNYSRGIYYSGNTSYPEASSGLLIMGNSIQGASTGIFIYAANAPQIIANQIGTWRNMGVNFSGNRGAARIERNDISGSGYYALNVSNHQSGDTRPTIATNHLRCASTGWAYSLNLDSSVNVDVFFNTIVMASLSSSAVAFGQSSSSTGLSFANNLVRGGGSYAAVFASLGTLSRLDHNLFFTNSGAAVRLGVTDISNLAAWIGATGDNSSLFADPQIVADGYTWPVGSPVWNAGIEIPGFAYDITANLRDNPDIGCWEYAVMGIETPVNLQISIDPVSSEVLLSWDPVAGASSYNVWYAASPDAASWSFVNVNDPSARLAASSTQRFYKVTAVN